MLFKNIEQFQEAKKVLIESEGDINKTFDILKESDIFSKFKDQDLKLAIEELNEGLGDKILNFFSGALGGDIAGIKTVLTQMKDQELKYNQEEFEIYNAFYRILQDQKALDKDKKNPDYQSLSKELVDSRNSLNSRMKELNKTHHEIFNSLEEKIKSLVGDNKRKKKFFNAQRATDVLETKNDRYQKIKSITAKSSERSSELEDFFGISVDKVKKEAESAKEKAEKSVENITSTPPISAKHNIFKTEPEKSLQEEYEKISSSVGGYYAKRKDLNKLINTIEDTMSSKDFSSYDGAKQRSIYSIYKSVQDLLKKLEADERKIK